MQEGQSVGDVDWWSLAGVALALSVAGAWVKDRLSINTKITRLETKMDILLEVHGVKKNDPARDA